MVLWYNVIVQCNTIYYCDCIFDGITGYSLITFSNYNIVWYSMLLIYYNIIGWDIV